MNDCYLVLKDHTKCLTMTIYKYANEINDKSLKKNLYASFDSKFVKLFVELIKLWLFKDLHQSKVYEDKVAIATVTIFISL